MAFATKPALARQMIERAVQAGVPFGWVAADEAYGQNTALRDWLEERRVSYVLAVPKSFTAATAAGPGRADDLAALVPPAGWQQLSCGDGAKGPRFYDWALIGTASPARHLLVRRPVTSGEQAFFTCHAPPGTPLSELVAVAGARWAVEVLPGRQERDRPGPLPGPPLRRLVPARHPVDACPGVPPGHRRSKGAPAAVGNFPGPASSMIRTT